MSRHSFPKRQHLRRPADFERIYTRRCAARGTVMSVFAIANGLAYSRVGLSVSRKHGGAVERNRIKRLLREAFRQSQDEMPGGLDLVIVPARIKEVALPELQRALVKAAKNLVKKLAQAKPESPAGSFPESAAEHEP